MTKCFVHIKPFICCVLMCAYISVHAQAPIAYETISTSQGLSQGMVFDILQDKEGFIWVATKNGLNRYDGYNFKVFVNDPYNTYTLSSNTILKLFEDSKGRLWVGAENAGINIYDKQNGKFYRIAHDKADATSLSGNGIRAIEEMADGRFLVGTDANGLNIIEINNGFFKKDIKPVITRLSLPGNTQVYGMGKDKNGVIWVGGMDGLVYQFNSQNNSFVKLNNGMLLNDGFLNADSSKLINNNLYLFNGEDIVPLFDSRKIPAGNIIFKPITKPWEYHHREELFYDVYKHELGKPIKWNEPLPKTTIRICYPFIIDQSGILWSGSVGWGLRKYNSVSSKFKIFAAGQTTRLIIPTANKYMYMVSYDYNWKKLQEDGLITDAFKKDPAISQLDNLIIASTGDYWFKSDEKGYFKYNPSTKILQAWPTINANLSFGKKQPFLEDRKANLWFPGQDGVITLLNTVTEKLDSFTINKDASKIVCTALFEDKQGTFWVGTEKGFAKVMLDYNNIASSQVKWFYNNSSNRNSLNYNHVSCFLDDSNEPDKYLWIATKGGGLNRLDKTSGDFFHISAKEGLPDDVVYGILSDDAGNIWGSSNKGIFCFKTTKNNNHVFYNFTKAYGLQDDEFNTGCYAKLSNGNLAFGGVKGINIFDPKEILAHVFLPNVYITDILINNQSVSPGDKTGVLQNTIEKSKGITLTYEQDILTLEFSSLDLTVSNQNRYRYQLKGVDKDWVESGTRRSATYLHLPAGAYVFALQGSNSQGIWSDKIVELQITVLPPWWRSWWAYLFYILVLGFAIRAYFKFKVNKAKLQNQLNFEQQEAKRVKELDVVKTQLYTNITHEFRTPLTVILGMAQQVKSQPDEYFDNGMNMIIRNGENLLNLVNEMLDLSKLESGKMELHLVNGDVINFLRYIVESFQSLAESQKKQFHFLSDIDSLHAAYDGEKLRQIVANLLSNALKFTPEKGNVYITIAAIAKPGTAYTSLIIKVKDTGIGIPESQLEHIFERFYQLDNSHTRKAEGTGIGLALTKELAKLMDGTIEVKSPPIGANKGTEFTVSLQLKNANYAEMENPDALKEKVYVQKTTVESAGIKKVENAHTQKQLILLVEDNADVVAYTASCLPEYRFAVGKDGKEGFEIATEIIPDLIITDVMMPYVDGFELCRMLRADERTSHIPIIMLTAKADLESRLEGLERGADVYLEKPFHKDELLLRIKKLLELRKKLQQYYTKQIAPNKDIDDIGEEIIVQANIEMAEHEFVKKVREAVETHMADVNFSVELLCKYIFMSHSQLHRKLDALTGYSPNKFIRIIRLNKAKELLRNPATSIASLALDCGYNDAGYFARVFKQEFGITPQEWRAKEKD